MATENVTPNLDATLAAGEAIAAGAAEVPVVPEVVDQDTLTDLEILNQEDAPEVKTEPVVEAPKTEQSQAEKDAAAAAKPDGEEKPAQTPEEKAAADAAAEAEMSPGDKAVRDLKTQIDKDPEKKALFEKDPAFARQMWRNARLAQEGEQYRETFSTVAIAKQARAHAEDFIGIRSDYLSGKTDGYKGLLKTLFDASVQRDSKGEPIKDSTGKIAMKPLYDDFFHHYRTLEFWPAISNLAKGDPQEAELTEAVQTIRNWIGEPDGEPTHGKPAAAAGADDTNSRLTPEEKARLAKLDTLEREQGTKAQSERETFNKSVTEAVDAAGTGFLLKRAKGMAPALSEGLQQRAASDTWKEIQELAKQDILIGDYRNDVLKVGGEDARKRWAAECVKYAEARYRPILEKHLRELGTPVLEQNADTRKKLDSQTNAKVIKGAGGPVSSPPPEDLDTQMAEGDKLSLKLHGRRLNTHEIVDLDDVIVRLRAEDARRPPVAAKK